MIVSAASRSCPGRTGARRTRHVPRRRSAPPPIGTYTLRDGRGERENSEAEQEGGGASHTGKTIVSIGTMPWSTYCPRCAFRNRFAAAHTCRCQVWRRRREQDAGVSGEFTPQFTANGLLDLASKSQGSKWQIAGEACDLIFDG